MWGWIDSNTAVLIFSGCLIYLFIHHFVFDHSFFNHLAWHAWQLRHQPAFAQRLISLVKHTLSHTFPTHFSHILFCARPYLWLIILIRYFFIYNFDTCCLPQIVFSPPHHFLIHHVIEPNLFDLVGTDSRLEWFNNIAHRLKPIPFMENMEIRFFLSHD